MAMWWQARQTLTARDASIGLQADADIVVLAPLGVTVDPLAGLEGRPVTLTGRFISRVPNGSHTVTIRATTQ